MARNPLSTKATQLSRRSVLTMAVAGIAALGATANVVSIMVTKSTPARNIEGAAAFLASLAASSSKLVDQGGET